MPNAPAMNDLYLERIYLLEDAYNKERDRADAAEAERDALRDALVSWIQADGTMAFADADEYLAVVARALLPVAGKEPQS